LARHTARHGAGVLVGRTEELARVDALLAAAVQGAGEALLVLGGPGSGRSALLEAAGRRAVRLGLRVVRVRAVAGQQRIAGSLLEDLAVAVHGAVEPSAVTGELEGMANQASAATTRGADALATGLVRSLAAGPPTVLLLDDLQHADRRSLEALATALGRRQQRPVGVVAACSPSPAVEQVLAGWARLGLRPLEPEAARALLRARLGPGHGERALVALLDAAQGDPLLLTSLPDVLTPDERSGVLPLRDPLPAPQPLLEAWRPVLTGLDSSGRGAVLDLAVAGDQGTILAAMATAPEALADGLARAEAAGLVVVDPPGRPRLRSSAARVAVLALADPREVRRAHHRAAVAGEELGVAPNVIVGHLVASAVAPDRELVRRIAAQAQRAEQAEALEPAARAYEHAARLGPNRVERVAHALAAVRLWCELGMPPSDWLLEVISGEYLDPGAALQLMLLRTEQRRMAEPVTAMPAMRAQVARARREAPESVLSLLAHTALFGWELGDPAAALEAATEFAERLATEGDATGEFPARSGPAILAAALFQAGEITRALPLRQAAIAAAQDLDAHQMPLAELLSQVSLDDVLLDISPEASERLMVAAQRVEAGSLMLPCLYGIQGWRARARGDLATARGLLEAGRPLAEAEGAIQPWLGMAALSVELAALSGDDAVLRADAARLREVGGRCGDRRRLATLDRAMGLRALVDGRLEEAVAALAAAADLPFLGRGLRDGILPARIDLVEALVRLGQYGEAASRHAEVHPLLVAMTDPLATALDERGAALLTSGAEAQAHFEAALAAHATASESFEQARTALLLGEHLRRERRRSAARLHLQAAVRAFEALGALPWAARAGQELRAAGGARASEQAGTSLEPHPLTAQERAVAHAVAAGMSNREVAETLVLSLRTVEYHLGNVYRKLGVHGRGALARALDAKAAPPAPVSAVARPGR
jgi:DNA-binding NarL/FixJ family response regulator